MLTWGRSVLYDVLLKAKCALSMRVLRSSCPMGKAGEGPHSTRIP